MKRILILCSIVFFIFASGCNKRENVEDKADGLINDPIDDVINDDPNKKDEDNNSDEEDSKIDDVIEDEFVVPEGKTAVYVSPNGTGDYTKNNPGEIYNALNNIQISDFIILRGGTYKMNEVIRLEEKGRENERYMIYAYKDEDVILDFGKYYSEDATITNEYNKSSCKGIIVSGNYYEIKGITIKGCGSSGMQVSGSYNLIENCVFAENGNTGLTISGSSSNTIDSWPSYNTILNCTSYGNYDWNRSSNQGEDADGFAPKLCTGVGNVLDGCIAYNNSDDGYDLFTKHQTGKIGAVTLKNCLAFNNGYGLDGSVLKNGNGFKLGGRALEVSHNVINCLAFNNLADGFCDNSNPGTITFKNCTSYDNGGRNFNCGRFLEDNNTYSSTWYEGSTKYGPIENVPMSHNIFDSCISYKNNKLDTYAGLSTNTLFCGDDTPSFYCFTEQNNCNSKYNKGNLISSENPFVTTNTTIFDDLYNVHKNVRGKDNNIYLGDFLLVNSTYMKYGTNNKLGSVFNVKNI